MKKIVFTVVVMLSSLATSALQAEQMVNIDEQNKTEMSKYYEIEPTDLTRNIIEAINNTYNNCRIDAVFVSNVAYAKYKVILFTQDRKKLAVYLDDKGVVLNEHKTF